eukprot:9189682-Prorocentrum_lima.AAC.1
MDVFQLGSRQVTQSVLIAVKKVSTLLPSGAMILLRAEKPFAWWCHDTTNGFAFSDVSPKLLNLLWLGQ